MLRYYAHAYVPAINFWGVNAFHAVFPETPVQRSVSRVPGKGNAGDRLWAATFEGRFDVRAAGAYTFCTNSAKGSDLAVDGALVVDNSGIHTLRKRCGTATLAAGSHDAFVNYFAYDFWQNDLDSVCEVTYSGPDTGNSEVLLKPANSCDFGPKDLVGTWLVNNGLETKVQIDAKGVGTWAHPNLEVKIKPTCGVFELAWRGPDDPNKYTMRMSADRRTLTVIGGMGLGSLTKISDAPPLPASDGKPAFDGTCSHFGTCRINSEWHCGEFPIPVRIMNGQVECMSRNLVYCGEWFASGPATSSCDQLLRSGISTGLACGARHKQLYAVTGYGDTNHWCEKSGRWLCSKMCTA